MSVPDATAIAALQGEVIKPVFFVWLDIDTDPVRANTSGADITPTGTGDADVDGFTFSGITGEVVSVSPVRYSQGGSESVTIELSGIPGIDDDTLALLDDPANWRGRDARLWRVIRNSLNVQQGGFHAYYTGKMTGLSHSSNETGEVLRVTVESYLAVFSQASNRTYLDQERFDPGDLSAKAAIAIANGNYTGAVTPANYGGGGGMGGGSYAWGDRRYEDVR